MVAGLLRHRADPNLRTAKDEPTLGVVLWTSPLDLAIMFRHNDVCRVLIEAGARQRGGLSPSMAFAAFSDNDAGINLLCAAGGNPLSRNILGIPSLLGAFGYGACKAQEEFLAQAHYDSRKLSEALHCAMIFRGGTAAAVYRLVSLRADVNFHYPLRSTSPFGLVVGLKSLQHRWVKETKLSEYLYHFYGMTALMAAMFSAQYEGAAALIAAGAKLDLRNSRGWNPAP